MSIILRPSEELCIKVYQTFDKTKEEVENEIKTLQDWLRTQHHLPEIMDYPRIRNFLLLNKFDMEKTRNKIDMYYTIRSLVYWFDDINPKLSHMQTTVEQMSFAPHPALFEDMYQVIFFKCQPRESRDICCSVSVSKTFFNIFEILLAEHLMLGQILVCDMGNFAFDDYTALSPAAIAIYWKIYEKVYALRLKALYYVNAAAGMSKMLTILKKFLKPKLYDRIKVCSDTAILKDIFPENFLLEDYGGKGPSFEQIKDLAKAKLVEYEHRFDQLDKLRVNESLRTEKIDFEKVQILMHAQQIKCAESVFGKSNYMWLCSKRNPVIWMSTKDEFLIRQALNKVSPDQQVKVMKQLLTWLDNHPEAHSLQLPEMSLRFLNNIANANLINECNLSRMGTFRNSLRRLSVITNRIVPAIRINNRPRRSVTFNDVPIIYRINK